MARWPFLAPGGSPDTIARTLAQHLQETWKQPVVVENRTGGSQNIGADVVAKSPPDGYAWLLAPDNVFVTNPYLAKAASFDPLTDLPGHARFAHPRLHGGQGPAGSAGHGPHDPFARGAGRSDPAGIRDVGQGPQGGEHPWRVKS